MEYKEEPIYIDDIRTITYCNGRISCVRFDKEEITIKCYNSSDKVMIMKRRPKELINCSLSGEIGISSIAYLGVIDDEFYRTIVTSPSSAALIKRYYDSYNIYLKNKFLEDEIKEEQRKHEERHKQEELLQQTDIYTIDKMSGYDFEEYIALLFKKMGYQVKVTKQSSDQGIDIIAEDNFTRIGIQAKCYSGTVGNKAIQEAVAGKLYYACDKVLVVTNSIFTKSAIELAKYNKVGLIDREQLKNMVLKYNEN